MFWKDAGVFLPILLQGLWLTIVVTVGSLLLSTVLGLVWALMRVSGIKVLEAISRDEDRSLGLLEAHLARHVRPLARG